MRQDGRMMEQGGGEGRRYPGGEAGLMSRVPEAANSRGGHVSVGGMLFLMRGRPGSKDVPRCTPMPTPPFPLTSASRSALTPAFPNSFPPSPPP